MKQNNTVARTNRFTPNKRTQNIVALMMDMLGAADAAQRKLVIAGGVGLDIEFAALRNTDTLTRDHGDLDIHPREEDITFWKSWFADRKFSIQGNDEIKDNTKAFVAFPSAFNEEKWETDPDSYYVDMYGIVVDGSGIIHSNESGIDRRWDGEWDDNFTDCVWQGRTITVLRHEKILEHKLLTSQRQQTPLRKKDTHDFKLFGMESK